MKRILIVLLALLLVQRGACATRNAASPTYSDVNFAVNGGGPDTSGVVFNGAAADGDIVIIPAGTASWTSTLIISHGITLQGQTMINGDHTTSPKMMATDYTIIQDGVPRTNGGGALISATTLSPTQSLRITGLTLQYGISITSFNTNGIVRLKGTCPSFRVDHCHLDQLYGQAVVTNGWLYGVVDHCIFDVRTGGGAIMVNHGAWGNQVRGWGSWAEPAYFGSEKFIFVEDNTANNLGNRSAISIPGGSNGARYVLRYNVINNAPTWPHGTEDATIRGVRAAEIYNNCYIATQQIPGGYCRGGTMLLHDNTYNGQYLGSITPLPTRLFQSPGGAGTVSVWAGADGTNPWDLNATEPDGTYVDGHAPYTFATETHIGPNVPSKSTEIVTVAGSPWTPNQWAGYTITNTNSASQYYRGHGYISSNTTNTITVASVVEADHPPTLGFNTGDTFAIHKVLRIIDQPGSGPSELIVGNPPGSTNLTGTSWPHYPNQALEPLYSWNNTLNGVNVNFGHSDAVNNLRENIDFYNNTPMPGYTPYTYPHPLVSGIPTPTPSDTPTPTPTPTVQVTVQTNPTGLVFSIDGVTYTAAQTLSWPKGSSHTIVTASPQSGGTGIQYLWKSWSDSGKIAHTIAPTTNATYTATFTTQYYLTMSAGTGGTVTPASGWKNSGVTVSISSTPTNNTSGNYNFNGWTGSGIGSYSGTNNPASITMSGPITETAAFTQNLINVTVQTNITGSTFSVDGISYNSAQTFSWQPGSSHTIATTSPQSGGTGIQYVWANWSDSGAISHTVAPTTNKTYAAKFTSQYFLTMAAGIGGTVTPASGWKASGSSIKITATAKTGYSFTGWSGTGTGSFSGTTNPLNITMSGPVTETATFTRNSSPTPTPTPTPTVTPTPTPNQSPVAVVGGPYNGTEGIAIQFDGSGSYDPDGTIASYDWDFNDGGPHGSGVNPTHAFGAPGSYAVSLVVTDNFGAQSSPSTTNVLVSPTPTPTPTATPTPTNQSPVAVVGGPYNGTEGIAIQFDGSGSYDPDGTIASYDWDFNDGGPHGSGVNPTHAFGAPGSYAVSLVVTDNFGAQSSPSTTNVLVSQ